MMTWKLRERWRKTKVSVSFKRRHFGYMLQPLNIANMNWNRKASRIEKGGLPKTVLISQDGIKWQAQRQIQDLGSCQQLHDLLLISTVFSGWQWFLTPIFLEKMGGLRISFAKIKCYWDRGAGMGGIDIFNSTRCFKKSVAKWTFYYSIRNTNKAIFLRNHLLFSMPFYTVHHRSIRKKIPGCAFSQERTLSLTSSGIPLEDMNESTKTFFFPDGMSCRSGHCVLNIICIFNWNIQYSLCCFF